MKKGHNVDPYNESNEPEATEPEATEPEPESPAEDDTEPSEVDDDGTPNVGELVHDVDSDGNPVTGPGGLTGHGIVIAKGDGTHTVGYFQSVQTVDSGTVKSGPEPTSAE